MNCINHPDQEAEFFCRNCDCPLCSECRVQLGEEIFCRPCLEELIAAGRQNMDGEYKEEYVEGRNKNRFAAFLFSLVPGVGYLYLGLMKRGLEMLVLFFGTIFLTSLLNLDELATLVLPVLFFYSVFDTQHLLGKMLEERPVKDRSLIAGEEWRGRSRNTIIAYGLIIVGAVALVNNTIPWLFPGFVLPERVLLPLLIIGLGVFILYRSTRRGGSEIE